MDYVFKIPEHGRCSRLTMVILVVFLLSTAIVLACFHQRGDMGPFLSFTKDTTATPATQDLQLVLKRTSMKNRTLIITVLNRAYASDMLDLFIKGFEQGENIAFLLNHVLFVSVDQVAYDRCNELMLHCYKLTTDGVDFSEEVIYMSKGFIDMMWRRTWFLSEVLRHNYSFVFTDMDVMWLRNPFQVLRRGEDMDLLLSCDRYNGRPLDVHGNNINTGFYFASSSNRTIALFERWYAARNESKDMKEQDVLERMKNRGTFRTLGLQVRILDTRFFAGFCQNRRVFRDVRTVHANCCRSIKAKLADLTLLLHEWRSYNGTDVGLKWPQKKACSMSWKEKLLGK